MIKHHFKKLVSVALAAVMVIGMSTTALASNYSNSVQVVTNNDNTCVVKEITADGITIATNNKDTGILTIDKYNSTEDVLLSTEILDLNAIAAETEISNDTATPQAASKHVYQHTFSNREYDCYIYSSYTSWTIRSGDNTKTRTENSSNASKLESFRGYVEDVNSAEFTLIGAVGAGAAATAITAFLSGGLAAGIAAAGGSAAVVAAFSSLNSAINSADYYYARI